MKYHVGDLIQLSGGINVIEVALATVIVGRKIAAGHELKHKFKAAVFFQYKVI